MVSLKHLHCTCIKLSWQEIYVMFGGFSSDYWLCFIHNSSVLKQIFKSKHPSWTTMTCVSVCFCSIVASGDMSPFIKSSVRLKTQECSFHREENTVARKLGWKCCGFCFPPPTPKETEDETETLYFFSTGSTV